jgi:hypothetical protein
LVYPCPNLDSIWYTGSDLALIGLHEGPPFQGGSSEDNWVSLQAFSKKVDCPLPCHRSEFLKLAAEPGAESAFDEYKGKREQWDKAWHEYDRKIEEWHDRKMESVKKEREWQYENDVWTAQHDKYEAQQSLGVGASRPVFSVEQWLSEYNDAIIDTHPDLPNSVARRGTDLVGREPFVILRHAMSFVNSLISEFWISGDLSGVQARDFPPVRPTPDAIQKKLKDNANSLASSFERKRFGPKPFDDKPNWLEYARTMACVFKVDGGKLPRDLLRVQVEDVESSKVSDVMVKWSYRIGWIVGPERSPCYSFPDEAHGSLAWRIEPDRNGVWHTTVVDVLMEGHGPIYAEYVCYVCVAKDDRQ